NCALSAFRNKRIAACIRRRNKFRVALNHRTSAWTGQCALDTRQIWTYLFLNHKPFLCISFARKTAERGRTNRNRKALAGKLRASRPCLYFIAMDHRPASAVGGVREVTAVCAAGLAGADRLRGGGGCRLLVLGLVFFGGYQALVRTAVVGIRG